MSYTNKKFGVDLTKRENWTSLLKYIGRSRFIIGFIAGTITGIGMGIIFMVTIYIIIK